ncbi:MAG TPA: alginate export family protein [Vicinamibacterales bacterium]|nr:alginate export family protein [Vicinamibacterales bacterium]
MSCLIAVFIAVLLAATPGAAQQELSRTYLPDRADEDWSFLKDAPRIDIWDPLKYVPLGREDWFLTLSGEVRYRPEGFRVRSTDTRDGAVDNYLLQRYLVGADVHFGRRARLFAELQSGIINGRFASPRPTDRNSVDLHQLFFEWRQPVRKAHRVLVKVGRQELAIGSTRLISASPGLNVKRSFDGAGIFYRAPTWTVVGAAARLVDLSAGAFDDRSDSGQLFWGVAAGRRSPRLQRGELAAYYLGIDRDESVYAQGLGPERRHTLGIKWNGAGARLDLNYDGVFQWGRFRDADISAWAFATETGYRLARTGWRPRVSLRVDIASGDDDAADPRLQSFNPLFPGNSYSGAVGLLGPSNLTDLTPALIVWPRPTLTIGFEAPSYWRTSEADGIYATDLRLLFPPAAGTGKYVGSNPGVLVVWQATRHLQFQGVVTRFLPGSFLEDTFVGSGFGFYSASAVYRF